MRRIGKKGMSMMYQMILHLILVVIIFLLFFAAATAKVNGRAVKQQVLEKQIALMIEAGQPGSVFSINKINKYGKVEKIDIKPYKKEGPRVFVQVNGLVSVSGYPFFSSNEYEIKEDDLKFHIYIK
jgi:hypothetical protein